MSTKSELSEGNFYDEEEKQIYDIFQDVCPINIREKQKLFPTPSTTYRKSLKK